MKHARSRKFLLIMFAVIASFLNQACSRAGLFVVNAPTYFSGTKTQTDIVYDSDTGQKLDVYMPEEVKPGSPVIVFFYGGRWSEGQKEDYRFVGSFFAQNGYIAVIPDYRKYPNVKFPAFVEDGAAALKWVSQNVSGRKIVVSGHSAGAHIGAILVSDERYLKNTDLNPAVLEGFVGLAGPYDFTPDEPDLMDMFGPPEDYAQMQVTSFIDGSEPPMLLLHGTEDEVVGTFNYEKVEAAIRVQKGDVETRLIEGLGHVELVSALTWVYRDKRPIDELILAFLERKAEKE